LKRWEYSLLVLFIYSEHTKLTLADVQNGLPLTLSQ